MTTNSTTADESTVSKLTDESRQRIAETTSRWPICMYSRHSRRHDADSMRRPKLSTVDQTIDMLVPLSGWNYFPEIAIDGMNGTGKSSLIRMLNRKYLKINEFAPHVTSGSSYNYDMIKSMQYMMLQPTSKCENVCWDRCCYSNLIFYYVHQLMYLYQDRTIPTDTTEVYMALNTIAVSTNLLQTLTMMENLKRMPTIFIVCRDFALIGEALRHRDTPNDVYNAKELNYQIAQYHVYRYFGEILKFPTFDLVDVFMLGLTLGDFHQLLKRHIDTPTQMFKAITPSIERTTRLNQALDCMSVDETLIYDYSSK